MALDLGESFQNEVWLLIAPWWWRIAVHRGVITFHCDDTPFPSVSFDGRAPSQATPSSPFLAIASPQGRSIPELFQRHLKSSKRWNLVHGILVLQENFIRSLDGILYILEVHPFRESRGLQNLHPNSQNFRFAKRPSSSFSSIVIGPSPGPPHNLGGRQIDFHAHNDRNCFCAGDYSRAILFSRISRLFFACVFCFLRLLPSKNMQCWQATCTKHFHWTFSFHWTCSQSKPLSFVVNIEVQHVLDSLNPIPSICWLKAIANGWNSCTLFPQLGIS